MSGESYAWLRSRIVDRLVVLLPVRINAIGFRRGDLLTSVELCVAVRLIVTTAGRETGRHWGNRLVV